MTELRKEAEEAWYFLQELLADAETPHEEAVIRLVINAVFPPESQA